MIQMTKRIALFLAVAAMALTIAACGAKPDNTTESTPTATPVPKQSEQPAAPATTEPPAKQLELQSSDQHPVLTIELSNDKVIKVELYPEVAPNTVNNMISLANKGFYDGLIFHRVIPRFMIQGGDPQGNGSGGPGYSIKGEFTNNGFENLLIHKRGVISMARGNGLPDSAGSQFFIMVADSPHLDKDYASFGEVIEGMDAVDEIVEQKSQNDRPLEPIAMKKVTVDTKNLTFEEPVIIK